MNRLELSAETIAAIADFKASYEHFDPEGLIYPDSNLVVDDHLEIDGSWSGVVLGGEQLAVWFCVPDWGNAMMPIDLIDYITDRAGPDGQTLPVFDEVQVQARAAAKTAAMEPKHAQRHRTFEQALRDALKKLPHDQQKPTRETLKRVGALKDDEHGK
jgi:hypothetical protein